MVFFVLVGLFVWACIARFAQWFQARRSSSVEEFRCLCFATFFQPFFFVKSRLFLFLSFNANFESLFFSKKKWNVFSWRGDLRRAGSARPVHWARDTGASASHWLAVSTLTSPPPLTTPWRVTLRKTRRLLIFSFFGKNFFPFLQKINIFQKQLFVIFF